LGETLQRKKGKKEKINFSQKHERKRTCFVFVIREKGESHHHKKKKERDPVSSLKERRRWASVSQGGKRNRN